MPARGTSMMKTARLAAMYAFCTSTTCLALCGSEYVELARCAYSAGSVARNRACSTAADTARPHAPPALRKKLRLAMMTARRDLGEWACVAIMLGCSEKPIPMPMTMRGARITPLLLLRSYIRTSPAPL